MYKAFHNDSTTKAHLCARLLTAWQEDKLLPIGNLTWRPEADHRSLVASLAETSEPEVFTAVTGLPVAPCLVFELLVAESGVKVLAQDSKSSGSRLVFQCSDTTRALPRQWLQAIRPGADLSMVLPRFAVEVMAQLLRPDSVWALNLDGATRAAADAVLTLWTRELAGEPVDAKTWKAARKAAEFAAIEAPDHWGELVIELFAQLAWPVEGLGEELPGILMPFILNWVLRVVQPHLPEQVFDAFSVFAGGPRRRRLLRAKGLQLDGSSYEQLDPESRQALDFINSDAGQKLLADGRQRAMPYAADFLRPLLERFVALTAEA